MNWIRNRILSANCSPRFLRVKRILYTVAPWPVLLLLFQALPGLGLSSLPSPFDALSGFLVGMGISWLWIGGLEAIETGFLGWVRAFAMGLTLATFLTGAGEALRGIRAGFLGTREGPSPNTWAGFTTYLLVSVALMILIRRMAFHRAEAQIQRTAAEEARQQALRARLAPHFIFNTLNTLHAQIEQDPRSAQATTERLAQLFRQVVEVSDRPTIPLKQELAFVEAYLGIEQARLGDRLKVSVEIPEDLETAEVPPLSLQVLVENAVKHGVTPLERGGEVHIGGERAEGTLKLWVEDPGTGASPNKGTGTALEVLRQRLEKPGDLTMERTATGFRVSLRWRQA